MCKLLRIKLISLLEYILDTSIQVEDIADSLNISRLIVLREVQEIKKQVGIVYIKKTKQ